MNFEFSFVGLLFLIMLFVPNIAWSRFKPAGYDEISENENRILLALERIGQVLVTVFALFCGADFKLDAILGLSILLMILYELYWVNYFKSSLTLSDMFSSYLWIPLPGATLPVFSFLLLGVYSNNILLIISSIILGIGHIGIHYNHLKEISS